MSLSSYDMEENDHYAPNAINWTESNVPTYNKVRL